MKYVYVISSSLGYQKIGHSKNPLIRIKALDNASPGTLTVSHTLAHPSANKIEKRVHTLLASYRVKGEWFNCDIAMILHCINFVINEPEIPNKVKQEKKSACLGIRLSPEIKALLESESLRQHRSMSVIAEECLVEELNRRSI